MNKKEKLELAKEVFDGAKALGCKITVNGFGTVFEPPIPIDLIMKAGKCGNELADMVRKTVMQDSLKRHFEERVA